MLDANYVKELTQQIIALPDDQDDTAIEVTRKELESYNYSPTLTIDVPDFLSATKADIANFIASLVETRAGELNQEDVSLILYHYRLLQKLRCNDRESWEYVTELMDED